MLKRALFISRHFPYDLDRAEHGIFLRMRMLLSALAAEADELDLLFFVPRDQLLEGKTLIHFQHRLSVQWGVRADVTLCPLSDQALPPAAFERMVPLVDALYQTKFAGAGGDECKKALKICLDRHPELIIVYCLDSMGPLLSIRRALPPVIFDLNDIEHVKSLRRIRRRFSGKRFTRKRLLALLSIPSLMRLERRAIRFADMTLVCSEYDRRYLSRWLRLSNLEVFPNAVSFPEMRERGGATPTIGYIGYFPYRPNKKAAEELITQIWPAVRARIPQAKLLLAGACPDRIPSFDRIRAGGEEYAGIEFAGFVRDLNHFYENVHLVCCPIRAAGGTRIKIIEAAAHGLPVVATRMAAEGLDFVDGAEIILRERPDKIAEACIALLSDPERCREIGAAARAKAAAIYEQGSVIASLQVLLRSVVKGRHSGLSRKTLPVTITS